MDYRDNFGDEPWELKLAQAYIPFQVYNQAYELEEALKKGTLFPELYFPYHKQR
ncbi:Spore coat associated protein JA (CotJA) [Halobacteroides halobius DSM 5150]|uniref:Spore coat associated protein JA (CotJA) n=1 Tax=Halobacteroides halobius (strain ATCC 35273 / DSM 5150 / MD-1) TaxID=748449 RepID=L0KDH7_HALHC|nr:spore coat associated protein CotJA [Halobacteroides halobius]AGB42424.1 Spore coat associated protein JA (CotJA) [Halobacteroides halobius DSM 5150]